MRNFESTPRWIIGSRFVIEYSNLLALRKLLKHQNQIFPKSKSLWTPPSIMDSGCSNIADNYFKRTRSLCQGIGVLIIYFDVAELLKKIFGYDVTVGCSDPTPSVWLINLSYRLSFLVELELQNTACTYWLYANSRIQQIYLPTLTVFQFSYHFFYLT